MPGINPKDYNDENYRSSMNKLFQTRYAMDRMNDVSNKKPSKGCISLLYNVTSFLVVIMIFSVLVFAIFGG